VFNLGMGEITVILLLALIFLGPKKLPELASGLGKIIRDIRKATSDVKNEIQLDDTFRKPFEELRDAVTLHPDELKRRDEIKRELEAQRQKMEELAAAEAAAAAAVAELTPPPEGLPPPSGTAAVPPPPVSTTTPPVPPPAPVMSSAPSPGAVMSSAPPPAPAVPTAPPAGTFARQTSVRPPTRLGAPRVTPPISALASDEANKTQSLSEEDLSPPTPGPATLPPGPPPPPPMAALGKRPPLLPGTPKAPSADADKKKA
jgi:sec-independent protein translocase protein TatB